MPDDIVGQQISTESSLSNWAGDYVTDMLGKGQALSNLPYEAYTGTLSAPASGLQNDAFGGIAGLTLPDGYGDAAGMQNEVYDAAGQAGQYDPLGYNPADYNPLAYNPGGDYQAGNIGTEMWNNDFADQYMNPYIQQALNPQLEEMARQSDIQRLQDTSRLTKAGAYGGSRQAIMESENNDNMMRLMAELTGKGYQGAYESGADMFTSDYGRDLQAQIANEQAQQYGADLGLRGEQLREQSRQFGATHGLSGERLMEDSRQFGANLGLKGIAEQLAASRALTDTTDRGFQAQRDIFGDQLDAGEVQRGITSEGLAADKQQFEEERDFPYKQVQYQHSLLGGMPLATQNYNYGQPSTWSDILSGAGQAGGILDIFGDLFGGGVDADAELGAEQWDFT